MQSNIDENGEAKLEAVQSNIDKKLSELKSKENIQFWWYLYFTSKTVVPSSAEPVGFGLVWFGLVRFGMVWLVLVRYGLAWFGLVWYVMVWFGLAWFGLVLLDLVCACAGKMRANNHLVVVPDDCWTGQYYVEAEKNCWCNIWYLLDQEPGPCI